MPEDYTKKLQTLLRKLFQFDSADLDFGIYRIMNRKRDVIEKFIEKDLIASVDTEFGKASLADKAQLLAEVEALAGKLGIGVNDDPAALRAMAKKVPALQPLISEFEQKRTDLLNLAGRDEHKAEVFNHIYQFFSRYYDNGDFMSMRRYSAKQKFAVPYNGEEMLLHWANKDQYYIKTGEYFFNYAFRVGEYTVRFQIVQAETTMNNTKAENRFFVLNAGEGKVTYESKTKELIILFEYRALTESEKASVGTRNVQDALNEQTKIEVLAFVPDTGLKSGLSRETDGKTPLFKHLATYAKRNTTDYFIHKDLSGFLTKELDFYIKNEMFDLDDLGTDKEVPIEKYLNRVRVMKAISEKIIAFLAQIEDFQKKLFEKKKFVLSADYCMTLNRVPAEFYPEIVKNTTQIAEWKALYGIGEPSGQAILSGKKGNIIDEESLKNYPYLVLDTKFFPQELKDKLLATFDNLDEATVGLMVKSENWQALNLLQERYQEQVNCIYIDPPYNTGGDEFLYKDNYQHSSWLAMMGDRIKKSYLLLSTKGVSFISIDNNEINNLNNLLEQIFGKENHISNIVWKKKTGAGSNIPFIFDEHEYVLSFLKNRQISSIWRVVSEEDGNFTNPDNDIRGPWESCAFTAPSTNTNRNQLFMIEVYLDNKNANPPLVDDNGRKSFANFEYLSHRVVLRDVLKDDPISFEDSLNNGNVVRFIRRWAYTKESINNIFNEKKVFIKGKNIPRFKKFESEYEGKALRSIYFNDFSTQQGSNDLKNLLPLTSMEFPKPTKLITHLIRASSNPNGTILDFFAGSGTTAQAVINLNREDKGNRQYILVEMGDHFFTVMKPRIQKVMYSSDWKDGKPQNTDGISHMFKYLTLEQYEDTLNNIEFIEGKTVQKTLGDMEGYVLRYMLDFETRESPCHMNTAKLERPFEYTLRITKDFELYDETVDLVETFNYLLGLRVKRIRTFAVNGTKYRVVHGDTLAGQETTAIWRTTTGLDLKQDKKFIEEKILIDPKLKAERVFINGDFHVEGALPIEPEFQRLMRA